jgi:hypothetical protein
MISSGTPVPPAISPTRRPLSAIVLALLASIAWATLIASPALAKSHSAWLKEERHLVNADSVTMGSKVGVTLPGGPEHFIEVRETSKHLISTPTGPADGLTDCRDAKGEQTGPAVKCVIEMAGASHGEFQASVAHETFHVFQAVMAGTMENYDRDSPHKDWLIEGSATWVEGQLAKHAPSAEARWAEYLRSPRTPLFSRSYDAVGFFGHMASIPGLSPWGKFKAMFEATGSDEAYVRGIGDSEPFLSSEASVYFREPKFGSAWNAQGAHVPSSKDVDFKPTPENVSAKAHAPLVVKPYADAAYDLSISALPASHPVLELTVVKGHLRLHSTSGGSVNAVDPTQLLLCSDPKGCSCPGKPSHFQQFKQGDLAITGGPGGAEVQLALRKPCEVLLPGRSCEGLLPDFDVPVPQTIKELTGQEPSAESNRGESSASICAFLAKGTLSTNAEGEQFFDGVTAAFVSVVRYPSVALATKFFKLTPPLPGFELGFPDIGEEADLFTKHAVNEKGEIEYASIAEVRVDNIVAEFALYGSPGNLEASPAATEHLLAYVAGKL